MGLGMRAIRVQINMIWCASHAFGSQQLGVKQRAETKKGTGLAGPRLLL